MAHNGQHLSGGYPPVSVSYVQDGSAMQQQYSVYTPAQPQPQGYSHPVQTGMQGYVPQYESVQPQPQSYGYTVPVYPQPSFLPQGQGNSFGLTQQQVVEGSAAPAPLRDNSGTLFSSQQPSSPIATVDTKEGIQIPDCLVEKGEMQIYSSSIPTKGQILYYIDANQKQVHYKYLDVLNNVVNKTVALRDLRYFFSVPKSTDTDFSDFLSKLQGRVYQEIKLTWTTNWEVQGTNTQNYPVSQPKPGEVLYVEYNGEQKINCKYWSVEDGALTLVQKEYNYASLNFRHKSSKHHLDELKKCIADRISKDAVLMFDLEQYKRTIVAELKDSPSDSTKEHKANAVTKLLAYLKGVALQPFSKEEEAAIQDGVFSRSRALLDRAKELYPELEGMLKPKNSEFSHFLDAQNKSTDGYATALRELQAGKKQSHWIWYIFPQIKGLALNPSVHSNRYAIDNLQQACRYLQDPLLFDRYSTLLKIVRQNLGQGKPLEDLFNGHIDSKKFISSITLFQLALETLLTQPDHPSRKAYESLLQDINATFSKTISQGYFPCEKTRSLCAPLPTQQPLVSRVSFFGGPSSPTSAPDPSATSGYFSSYQREHNGKGNYS